MLALGAKVENVKRQHRRLNVMPLLGRNHEDRRSFDEFALCYWAAGKYAATLGARRAKLQ